MATSDFERTLPWFKLALDIGGSKAHGVTDFVVVGDTAAVLAVFKKQS